MKSSIINKIIIFAMSLAGEATKLYYKCNSNRKHLKGINLDVSRKEKVIVSLTSYGRRVNNVVPYAIISLLNQTYKPDLVILWLDKDNWKKDNIPTPLQELSQKGLTIRFVEDLYSYKKHVPALEAFPDDIIITVDDDFYYKPNFIKQLINAYEKDPNRIYTHRAHRPTFDKNGGLLPYNKWIPMISNSKQSPIFATTGGGCLFKSSLLYKDATNKSLFTKLCPKADDVWFYFMEILAKTPTTVLKNNEFTMIPLDNFYQLTHKGSNLSSLNVKKSFNDIQIENIMNYYHISPSDLML